MNIRIVIIKDIKLLFKQSLNICKTPMAVSAFENKSETQ